MRRATLALTAAFATAALVSPVRAAYQSQVFNTAYTYVFRGTESADWGTVGNWYTTEDGGASWTQHTGEYAPGMPNSNLWSAVLLDGDLMDDTHISVDEDGYKTVSLDAPQALEGWNTPIGVAHGVHLKLATVKKLQGTTLVWRVDESSKITVGTFGVSGNNSGGSNVFYVDSPEGITFSTGFGGSSTLGVACNFGEQGSIKFVQATGGGSYTVASVALDCGRGNEGTKQVVSRTLIAYASKTATMTVTSATVSGSYQDGRSVTCTTKDSTPTVDDEVGTYQLTVGDTGVVITYVTTALAPVATLSGGEAEWTTDALWDTNSAPTSGRVQVKTTADTILTVAAAELESVTFCGPAETKLTGEAALTAQKALIWGDVDVSGAANVSLGAVSIAPATRFTVNGSAPTAAFTSLTPEDATTSNYVLSAPASGTTSLDGSKTVIAAYPGTVTLLGTTTTTGEEEAQTTTSTGFSLQYGIPESSTLKAKLVFSGGAHAFQFGRDSNTIFSTVKGDVAPAVAVKDGAKLTFCMKDLSGWGDSLEETSATIRVYKDSELTFTQSGSSTGFFRNRLVLDGGATATTGAFFILYGGPTTNAAQAQIAMLDAETTAEATLSGTLGLMNTLGGGQTSGSKGASVAVGENATLTLAAAVVGSDSATFRKLGAGTLKLTSSANTATLPLAVDAGRVVVANGAKWASTLTVAGGATLEVVGTPANTLSLAAASTATAETPANFIKSGTGDADWSALTGNCAISFGSGASGTLTLAAGMEGSMTVPTGTTLQLVLSPAQLVSGYTSSATISGTLVFKKRDESGQIVALEEQDGSVNGSTFTATSNTWTVAEGETSGTWSDGARWSRGSKPAEGEVARVFLSGDVTLTVDEAATLADLWVAGTGKLTLAGEQRLTVSDKLVVEATELVASAVTLAPAATEIAREATFTYENGEVSMPSLTGEGTFAKTGAAQLTLLAGNTYDPAIVVSGGTLLFDNAAHTQAYRVRVKSGATVQVGTWTGGLTNSEASLTLEAGGTLSLPNGNTAEGSSTVAASITVDSGATAENPAIIKAGNFGNNARITGAIGSSGETAGALRFDKVAENHLTIAGKVANVHLINNTLAKLTVSGAISGGGSVTVKGGEIALAGQNSYTGATTIEAGGTLTLAGGADTLAYNTSNAATVTVNGKLQAQNNGSNPTTYYRKTVGAGEIYVPANQTFAIGLTNNTGESGLTGFTGTLRVAGTFDARNWKADETYTISGFDVAFEGSAGVITKYSGANPAAVTIAAGKTLSGSGTIALPTTFVAGAVIDARSESGTVYSTLSGDVTLPEGLVKVLANAYGPVLGKAGLDITKFAVAEGGTLTEGVFAPVGDYLYVVQKPTVPSGTDAAAAEAIARAALQSGASFTQVTEASAATGCQVDGAALFDNVVKFTAATGSLTEATALVSYDFGISKMTPTTVDGSTTVTVSAKVAGRETSGAQIAAGTRLQLRAEGVEAPLAEKTVDAAAEEVAFDAVAAEQLIGKRLSVRATK